MAVQGRGRPPLDRARLRLLLKQRGRCPLCGELLLHADTEPHHPDDWALWITATSKAIRHHAVIVDGGPESLGYTASVSSTRTASAACQTALPVRQHSAAPTDEPSGLA